MEDYSISNYHSRLPHDCRRKQIQSRLAKMIFVDSCAAPVSRVLAPRFKKWLPLSSEMELDTSIRLFLRSSDMVP
eukprot:7052554-Pyramimonas_sp.AAC.1